MTTLLSRFRPQIDRSFVRRAATRMAASVAVMGALGAVSHGGPKDETPALLVVPSGTGAPLDLDLRPVALTDATSAKTARLQRNAPARAPALILAKAEPEAENGVLFFDRCRPLCESGDPLLPGRHVAETVSAEPLPQSVSFEPQLSESPSPSNGVLGAMTSGLSAVADGASRLLSW